MDDGAIVLLYLVMAAVLPLIPMSIASSKGHDAIKWWAFGFILWIVALPAAILIKPTKRVEEEEALAKGDSKKCPQCAEVVKKEAAKCRFCGFEFKAQVVEIQREPLSKLIACPSCRRQIPRNLSRCAFCKQAIGNRQRPNTPPRKIFP